MPKKVLPTAGEGKYLGQELIKLGFRQVTRNDWKFVRETEDLKVPRKRTGYEIGYVYFANGYLVYVWTTFDAETFEAFESDAGWVLVVGEGNKRLYSSPRLHRTKYFISRILSYAWICKWKIDHRPLCPECKKAMVLARGKHLKQRYWKCAYRKGHVNHKNVNISWDSNLPKKAQKFLDERRKKRSKYRKKRRKEGKSTDQAMLRRKTYEKRKR